MPSNSSQNPNKNPLSVVITSDVDNSTNALDTSLEERKIKDKYRQELREQLDGILMEYITNDTDFTPYDFVSDLRSNLYGIQDYFQDYLNRTNAILSYLNGQTTDDLFNRKSKEIQ